MRPLLMTFCLVGALIASSDPIADAALARLSRVQKEENAILKAENEDLARTNVKLENDIARSQGKTADVKTVPPKPRPVIRSADLRYIESIADIRPSDDPDVRTLSILLANLDCTEAIIEKHNAEHPDDLRAGVGDLSKLISGTAEDQERLRRAKACAEHFETPPASRQVAPATKPIHK